MPNKAATIVILILIPLSAFATPRKGETANTTVHVDTLITNIHGSSSGNLFSYTDRMFARVNGKRIVLECAERGDYCPVLESGRAYNADQEKSFIYISSSSPEGEKTLSTKYKQVGIW